MEPWVWMEAFFVSMLVGCYLVEWWVVWRRRP